MNDNNDQPVRHAIIGVTPGTRLQRIVRLPYGWRLWLATRDYIHGTYTELHNNGAVITYITRADEGDEIIEARPSDAQVREMFDYHNGKE